VGNGKRRAGSVTGERSKDGWVGRIVVQKKNFGFEKDEGHGSKLKLL
jgi:hypothetical protein